MGRRGGGGGEGSLDPGILRRVRMVWGVACSDGRCVGFFQ